MTDKDVTNDMRYWNQRRRAIRRAPPKTSGENPLDNGG